MPPHQMAQDRSRLPSPNLHPGLASWSLEVREPRLNTLCYRRDEIIDLLTCRHDKPSLQVSARDSSWWDLGPSSYRRPSSEAQPGRSHSYPLFRSCHCSMRVRVFQGPMLVCVLAGLREPSLSFCVL